MSDQWLPARLSDYVDIAIGGTPSRSMSSFWTKKPAGHPWLAISDLQEKYLSDTRERITDLGVRSSNVKLIPSGSTVMSFKLSVGRTAITGAPMYSNEAIAAFLPRSSAVDSSWLYHVLPRASATVVTDSAVKGVTLNKAKMAEMTVLLPSPREQQTIANILDTLDTTIHQTEAIIEKLKQVKQALLHDLLTRGIDANGELRPPQSQAPHLYKDSPLGWIPCEWSPVQIGKLAALQRGHDIVEANFVPGAFPVISSSGVIGHHNIATSRGPNVVVGRKGSIGTVHYVASDFWAHDTSLFVTNFFGNDVRFVYHLFDYLDLGRFGTKSGSPSLNRNDVHPLIVGRPTIDEQSRVVEAITAYETAAHGESRKVAKLKTLKSGLMDDLLTGRVRVTPLLQGSGQSPSEGNT